MSNIYVFTHHNDLIGCEVGGAVKNAIAVISGAATGLNLGENARAAVITEVLLKSSKWSKSWVVNGKQPMDLTGVGDLIVTASSENSRNFQAGKKLGMGYSVESYL
jgi:glycerol-3-phosphate dehydrogenase (NAD(P)+)